MKILTISNYYPSHPGGIEIVAQNLVLRWRRTHFVHWAACDVPSYPYTPKQDDILLVANNFTESRFGFPYPIPTLGSIYTIFKEAYWCDIIHVHDCLYFANLVAAIASWLLEKPLVVTQHVGLVPYREPYKNILQQIAYQTIGRMVLKCSDEVIFINQNVKIWFETHMGLPKTAILQNGVDHEIFYPAKGEEKKFARIKLGLPEDSRVLLFVGRFTQKKGVDVIYEIAKARPSYQLVMLGGGEIDVSTWSLPNVTVLPHQPQITLRNFYISADVLLLPSKGEGFPLAVQEALSCGLPAIVSNETASSLPDAPLIGLDIESTESLIRTLDEILEENNRLSLFSTNSIEYARRWDWDIISRQYEDHFRNLLSRRLPRHK